MKLPFNLLKKLTVLKHVFEDSRILDLSFNESLDSLQVILRVVNVYYCVNYL